MLIAGLTKYWKSTLTEEEFWFDMDVVMTNSAITFAGFTEEMQELIWITEKPIFGAKEIRSRIY